GLQRVLHETKINQYFMRKSLKFRFRLVVGTSSKISFYGILSCVGKISEKIKQIMLSFNQLILK
ncbi:hypothetical protein, partial [Enterococcus faecium]|uniref:hypothetical protein n=1 Tax=Enterococcus faecium TaxID=1352 RepID=UPI001963A676